MNVPLVSAYFFFPAYHLWLWGVIGFGASGAVFAGVLTNRPVKSVSWILVGLGLFTFAAGDTSYNILTQYLHETNPYPSIADGFYLITYVLLAAGVFLMVRARRGEKDLGPLLDASVITSSALLLSWLYLIEPQVHASGQTVFQRAISIAYPLGDILILSVFARLLSGGAGRSPALALLATGGISLLVADSAYAWIQLNGSWKVGGPTDLGWVLFYVLWGSAALHPSTSALTETRPRRDKKLSTATLLSLSAATLVAPGLLVWRSVGGNRIGDAGVIGVTAAVIVVIVMARLSGLARSQAAYARRESAIRGVAERIVGAGGSAENALSVGVDALTTLVGRGLTSCLVCDRSNGSDRVVYANPASWIGSVLSVEESASGDVSVKVVAPEGDELPANSEADVHWTTVSSGESDAARLRILIESRAELTPETLDVLDTVSAQLTLALDRIEATRELHKRQSDARFRSLVQNLTDVIIVVEPSGRIRNETDSLTRVLGYAPSDIDGLRMNQLLHPDDMARAAALIEDILAGQQTTPIRGEWRVRHLDGRWLETEVTCDDLTADAEVGGIVLTLHDISERKTLEAELKHRAFHDSLTDLPNRSLFLERVADALRRRPRLQTTVALLIVDVDDFKLVNDTLGHPAGDQLLVQLGERLDTALGARDTTARLGGDEFAVLAVFESAAFGDVERLVDRLLNTLNQPISINETVVRTHVSIGATVAHSDDQTGADLLREADLALYAAKRAGKGTSRFFEPGLHEAILTRLALRSELESALTHDELRVYYQPIVKIATAQIVGFEALVRWQHPERGLIEPGKFIDVAEESGLIVPAGAWVLERTCADMARWRARLDDGHLLKASVNVSPLQLQSDTFLDTIDEALRRHSIDPSLLTLEITENALLDDSDQVLVLLQRIRQRGVSIYLDDFGTGYSSLSYLQRFPLNGLKIDRSFVQGTPSADHMSLVTAIISMANNLNLGVVAEGIENDLQAHSLETLGCELGQGYLYSRPVPAEEVFTLVARNNDFQFQATADKELQKAG